jgi:hypothetical protein
MAVRSVNTSDTSILNRNGSRHGTEPNNAPSLLNGGGKSGDQSG